MTEFESLGRAAAHLPDEACNAAAVLMRFGEQAERMAGRKTGFDQPHVERGFYMERRFSHR